MPTTWVSADGRWNSEESADLKSRLADNLGNGKVSADGRKRNSEDSADMRIRHAHHVGSGEVSAKGRKRHSEDLQLI